ncbi:MAG: type II toxin-antitoxin system VapC family toxin [Deltaproteobacteria bacterium]|nr:type II toxin-antitoxin system VapC family toxin [Deltaproteobacteria bacterium]
MLSSASRPFIKRRWLLGAPDADAIAGVLAKAERVVTSAITSAEVGRALRRLVGTRQLSPEARDKIWVRYTSALAHWNVYGVTDAVLSRTLDPFPAEPVRTLDAIHIATAALYAAEIAPPSVLSADNALRQNAIGVGLAVTPAE